MCSVTMVPLVWAGTVDVYLGRFGMVITRPTAGVTASPGGMLGLQLAQSECCSTAAASEEH